MSGRRSRIVAKAGKASLTDVIAHVSVGRPTAYVAAGEIDVPRELPEN
jgi:hypothetical protein